MVKGQIKNFETLKNFTGQAGVKPAENPPKISGGLLGLRWGFETTSSGG
jgi:hypothetical protein